MQNVVELVSPSPLEECRRLLRAEMDRPFTFGGKQPLIGWNWGANLSARKRIRGRNSFQTMLWAKMIERSGQTYIYCRFHIHPFVVVFMLVWFGALIRGLFLEPTHPAMAPSYIPLTVMILFGLGLISGGLYLARGERQFLIDFLCKTLRAKATA